MSRRPIHTVLLGAFLCGSGCYRVGHALPVPQTVADTAAITAIEAARTTHIEMRSGRTTRLESTRVEYPALTGLATKRGERISVSMDSILQVHSWEKDRVASGALGGAIGLFAGSLGFGLIGAYGSQCDDCSGPSYGAFLAIPGAALGLILGAIIGAH